MDKRKFLIFAYLVFVLALIALTDATDSSSSSSNTSGTSNNNNNNNNGHSHKSSSSSTATQARQSPISAAASMVGALGSLVPSLITNVAPLVLLFGIGAMMMPSLGMNAMNLLRESRRSAHDQPLPNMQLPGGPFAQYSTRPIQTSPQDIYYFTKRSMPSLMSSFNSEPLKTGLQELLVRVVRAIDNADKQYN